MSKRKLKDTNITDEDQPQIKLRKIDNNGQNVTLRLQLRNVEGILPINIGFNSNATRAKRGCECRRHEKWLSFERSERASAEGTSSELKHHLIGIEWI